MRKYQIAASISLLILLLLTQLISYGQQKFDKFQADYKDLIKNYQFSEAIKLCEDALKKPGVTKDEKQRAEIGALLEDAKYQHEIFDKLIKQLNGIGAVVSSRGRERTKLDLGTVKIWIDKADEEEIEGTIENVPGSRYIKLWRDIDAEVIYKAFDMSKLDYQNRFNLALFCYDHNLAAQADLLLIQYNKRYPDQKDTLNHLLARKKGIPMPEGGFMVYHRRWVTAEEKDYLDKGYVKHEGKWMTYDEMMKAKGLVKYKGRWITKEQADKFAAAHRRLVGTNSKYTPTGVINLPGCDSEQLSWDQARVKETEHYIVEANLSEAALTDLAFVMESLYFYQKLNFRLKQDPAQKMKVYVFKNRSEFQEERGNSNSSGFYSFGKDKYVVTFYQPRPEGTNTTSVLLHEGTHQFVDISLGILPPIWIHEGLATYYESSKFEKDELVVNLINKPRLNLIKQMLNSGSKFYMPLRKFINVSQRAFDIQCYCQGWSLVYYLANGRDQRYAQSFNKYFDELKKGGITLYNVSQPGKSAKHIDIFERVFKIPLEDLEEEWKEYMLNLTITDD